MISQEITGPITDHITPRPDSNRHAYAASIDIKSPPPSPADLGHDSVGDSAGRIRPDLLDSSRSIGLAVESAMMMVRRITLEKSAGECEWHSESGDDVSTAEAGQC